MDDPGRADTPQEDDPLEWETAKDADFKELALLWHHSKDVVTVLGVDGSWLWSSPAGTRLLGHQRGYDPDGGFFGLVHPDDAPAVIEAFGKVLDGTRSGDDAVECRVRTADDNWRWYETTAQVMLDDPLVGGVVLWSHDITERREAEQARAAATGQFETVFRDSPAGIVLLGEGGRVLRANPALTNMLGVEEELIQGNQAQEWMPDEDQPSVEKRRAQISEAGKLVPIQRKLRRADGTWVECQVAGALMADSDPPTAVFHVTDLTETVAAERKAAEAQARFTKAFDIAPVGMALMDDKCTLLDVNSRMSEILGDLEPLNLVGRSLLDFFNDGDRGVVKERIETTLRTGDPREQDWYQLTSDDDSEMKWCRVSIGAVETSNGGMCAVVYIEDQTEQIRSAERIAVSESRYRLMTEAASDVVILSDPDGTIRYVSPSAKTMLGQTPEQLIGKSGLDLMHEDDTEVVTSAYLTAQQTGQTEYTVEVRNRLKEKANQWLQLTGRFVRDEAGKVKEIRTSIHDITELRAATRAVESSERRFKGLVQQSFEYTMLWDKDGVYTYVSPNVERDSYGQAKAGRPMGDSGLVHPEDKESLLECARQVVDGKQGHCQELRFRAMIGETLGQYRWLEGVMTNLLDDPDVQGVVFNARDIQEKMQAEISLAYQARHDELTGLLSRGALLDVLRELEAGNDVAVLFCDLDNFKIVNDTWGHDTGDRLLQEVANRLVDSVRDGDTVARFGGDEFVVVCPASTAEDATAVAERICHSLSVPVSLSEGAFPVMASIGIAMRTAEAHSSDLLRDADTAMYEAKRQGRNRYQMFNQDMRQATLAQQITDPGQTIL